jgi:monofunctional glycosyltransferase
MLTATGSAIGTPTYMSPEQSSGARDITGAADQYSLGCVAFEMLTGAPPFAADTVVALIFKHYTEEPPSLSKLRPDCPSEVVSAVHKMLQKAPEDRFASLDEAAQVFRDASSGDEESLRLLLRAFAMGEAAADEAVRRRTPSPTATMARATEVRRGGKPVSREVAAETTASSGAPTSSLPPLGAASKGVATKATGNAESWPRTLIPAQQAKPKRASRWRAPGVFTVLMAVLAAVIFVFPRVGGLAASLPEETAIQAQRRAAAEAAVQRGEAPGADGDCSGIRADLPSCRVHTFVTLQDIAPVMVEATLAAQDPGFEARTGVDWSVMRQAAGYPRATFAWGNAADREDLLPVLGALPTRMATAGAAGSLTQQLVQQVYFPVSEGLFRKLREIATAQRVGESLSRDRILELYLNSADFGPGLYGVEAAAQAYFKVPAAKLTRSQAATLAAILIAPRASNPNSEPAAMRQRQALILRRLAGEDVRVPLPGLTPDAK